MRRLTEHEQVQKPGGRRRAARLFLLALTAAAAASLLAGSGSARLTALNPIQAENSKAGTPGWDDFASVAQQDAISGYGSKISVNHGDSLDLYVTTTASTFTIDVFRTGWYGGVGARLVAALGSFPGVHQAIPPPDPVTGMVSAASWTKTTTLAIPSDWVTGVYLARLSASNGNKSFIFFVVRNDGGSEPIAFQTSVTTYQAYNAWGGVSLYTNNTNRSVYKSDLATKVSFDRPFDPEDSNGAGHFLYYEYPFIRWAESQGYDIAYTTDVDTDTTVLTNHRAFLSVGHDEYWTKGMRDNVSSAIAHGVNAAFFSANTAYWQIRLEPNAAGTSNRVEVCYKDSSTFGSPPGPDPQFGVNNSIVTTRWRDAPVNLPENGLLGVMYQDQVNANDAYVVQNSGNWIYNGTGFTDGTKVPGIVGYEYDKVWNNGASPPGLTVLSSSPVVGCCEGSGNSVSNSTLYTAPSGAQVFAGGTIQWAWGLDNYSASYANAGIQKTTANILNAFSSGGGSPSSGVAFSPTSLSFSGQRVGVPSAAKATTLTNVGAAPLTITSIAVTGANASDYSQTNTCPASPATVAPGATCTISVTFTPAATGSRSGSISVVDDAAGSPQSVALSGSGTAPVAGLAPSSLTFASQAVGTTSAAQTATLTNSGTAPLAISSIGLTGTRAGEFQQTTTCASTLAAGSNCTISVKFAPSATGNATATLSVVDDAPSSPQTVSLSGAATLPAPAVTLSPVSLAFGSQAVGTTSAARSTTLTNTGSAALTVSSVTVTGSNAGDFAQSNTCPMAPSTLAPNASCTISVTVTPTAAGSRSASVSISDDAAGSPHAVALTAAGGTSSIAFDQSLGTKGENAKGSQATLTTIAAAAPGSRIFVFVNWNSGARTLATVSGGGLTWTVDRQAKNKSNFHGAIASANAPVGLTAGTVITATYSASVTKGLIAAVSFTGVAPTSPLDIAGSSVQGGVAGWTASVATTNANDLVVGWSGIDANATSAPTPPSVEIHDFGNANYFNWATSVYRIESTTGAKPVSGTWSQATGATANVTVVAAYRAA